jgi:hypothetical protein
VKEKNKEMKCRRRRRRRLFRVLGACPDIWKIDEG